MLKLAVNPGTEQAWEIPLAEGVTVLGSDPASEFAIAHDTVSPAHCEIRVTDGAVAIKDLGSAGGTFINNEPVSGGGLAPGQTLRLGGVALQLVSDAPTAGDPPVARRIPVSIPEGATVAATQVCKFHPRAAAAWHCGHCREHFCDLCVNVRRVGETARHLCRKCGNDCTPVAAHYTVTEEKGFYARLPGAFSFPFKGDGVILLVAGTVFFLFLQFLGSLAARLGPYGGAGAAVAGLAGAGYLFNYAKEIVLTSAQGRDDPPDWPDMDFTNWNEAFLAPAFELAALVILTFGPAIALRWWHPLGDEHADAIRYAAAVLGALLAPMGMLALAMFDNLGALNPVALIWSISRIPLPYLAAAAAFELALGFYFGAEYLAKSLGAPGLITGAVLGFLNLYALTAGMRILGLLYRTNKERLGWFSH